MTSLDGINGRSIQTLLTGENDSKQSDEFQATELRARPKFEYVSETLTAGKKKITSGQRTIDRPFRTLCLKSLIAGGDYFFFRTKRGRLFVGGD